MSIIAPQAALAAPFASRTELDFPGRVASAPFPDWAADRDLADRLAWRNDHETNDDENYPGDGWDAPGAYEPSPDVVAALHDAAPDDHDAQPGPPSDFELATPDDEYWSRQYERWAEEAEHELFLHNWEVEGYGRFSLVPFVGSNHP